MIRLLDKLGRICIPVEIRKQFDWNEDTKLKITTTHDGVMIKKATGGCIICGSETNVLNVTELADQKICLECMNKIKSL